MHNSNRRIASFLAMAFGFTWTVAGIGALLGVNAHSGLSYMALAAICMFGPVTAAVVQLRVFDKGEWNDLGLTIRGVNWRALIWTSLIGLSIVPLAMVAIMVFGDGMGMINFGKVSVTGARFAVAVNELMAEMGATDPPSGLNAKLAELPGGLIMVVLSITALIAAFSFNLPFMLGEELGWRGYLYNATGSWSTMERTLFTGVVWGLWHAPLIMMGHNYPGYPILGIGFMVVFCVLLAFLFDWSRTRTKAIWGPAVLHGLINGTAGAMALFAWDGHILFGSPVGIAGFAAIAALVLVVILFDGEYRRSLS